MTHWESRGSKRPLGVCVLGTCCLFNCLYTILPLNSTSALFSKTQVIENFWACGQRGRSLTGCCPSLASLTFEACKLIEGEVLSFRSKNHFLHKRCEFSSDSCLVHLCHCGFYMKICLSVGTWNHILPGKGNFLISSLSWSCLDSCFVGHIWPAGQMFLTLNRQRHVTKGSKNN